MTSVDLPEGLFSELVTLSNELDGFSDEEELVRFVLDGFVDEVRETGSTEVKTDEEAVENRLKQLGYME